MKRKLLLFLAMIVLSVCFFVISATAEALTNYASVKLTLVDGTEATGYCKVEGRFLRDNIYKNPENIGDGTYAWADIKVFDMRDSVIFGNKTYSEVGGLNCNTQAVNVEEYYFSSQVTRILNTTFTSGWKALKTVYVPNTVTEIQYNSFQGSPIERVVFEEGSQLLSIGDSAFQSCVNLTSVTLPEGLQSLGRNCFFQSGLSGTVIIPNSVTKLDAGALLSTKIENLYLGDGALEIGYNFLGTFSKTDNQYLKNVYISASTTFTATNIFYKCANSVNFYIVGSEEECSAMVNTLKAQSTGDYMTFIAADEVTENTGAGYGIIHTEYNRCDAFYKGEHLTAEEIYYFASFEEKSYVKSICPRCNVGTTLNEIAPLFICLGYSAPESGRVGIAIGYIVNKDAIKEYEEITGKIVKYGVFVASQRKLGDNDIFAENGEVAPGVINAEFTNCEFVAFDLNVFLITYEQKDVKLAMGAYVIVADGEATEYSYIQDESEGTTNGKYYFVSYSDIEK